MKQLCDATKYTLENLFVLLTLSAVAENPAIITESITTAGGEPLMLRPLEPSDLHRLAAFLAALSPETRRLFTCPGYDLRAAQEMCDAINRYDKLRLVVEAPGTQRIVGLLEFSMAITDGDQARFAGYGITLDPDTDCRFGPCLADDYQNSGLGSAVLPYVLDVTRRLGQKRIILWGGVLSDNARAIRYYEKNGFRLVGEFKNQTGIDSLDMILELT